MRSSSLAYLADMAIGVVQLNAELHLVTNLDALGIRVLQTAGQCLRHIEIARELVSLCGLLDDFEIILIHLMLVGQDRPGDFVRVANGIGIFGVKSEVVAFDKL